MKLLVEGCCGGNSNFYFRIETPRGRVFVKDNGKWNRKTASLALDEISRLLKVPRKNIRFRLGAGV